MTQSIQKILIANRGEIAVRVIRTAREMGLNTVAVYSELDRTAPHVVMADEAYSIGPTPAKESYLDFDRIMAVAGEAGVDAIHPGYGFLSENPEFPRRCNQEEIVFVGPSASSIELAGNKINARSLAESADVPTVPGEILSDQTEEDARRVAEEIGFPVLIKAAAGGGGKGMRVVEDPESFEKAFREARREAENAFGNPDVFIEKYFKRPRHIEIQIMADQTNHAVHFGERECSIQRRHQKLVEEAPSTIVDEELRERMGKAAVRLVCEAEYTGAGTVEFLLDRERNFYFLEINTRLQVEHTVSEMLTGFDLVREQIRVANGEELGYGTEQIPFRGWAMECRVCAEDPSSDFAPSTGTIQNLVRPEGPFTRFDVGVKKGSELTMHYDSLIGKLICCGQTRDQVIQRMKRALDETMIVGVDTTIPLFHELLNDDRYRAGELTTRFLDSFSLNQPDEERKQTAAKIAALMKHRSRKSYEPSVVERDKNEGSGSSNWFRDGLRRAIDHGE